PASLRSPSLSGTAVASVSSLSQVAGRRAPVSLDLWSPVAHPASLPRRRRDLPGSWASPCMRAALSDPGGTSAPGLFRHRGAAALAEKVSAPTKSRLSRLNRAARTLAVYASPYGLPHTDARLAYGGWPAFAVQGSHLLGSLRRVSEMATS